MSYFDEKEVRAILNSAVVKSSISHEMDVSEDELESFADDIIFSRAELEKIAFDAGISMEALDESIAEVQNQGDELKIEPSSNVLRVANFGLSALLAGGLGTLAILFSCHSGIAIVFNINYEKLANQVEPRIEAAANASSLEIASSEIDQALQVLDQNPIVQNSLSENSSSPSFGSMPKDEDIVSLYQNITVINRHLKAADNDTTEAEIEKLNRKLDQLSEYYQPEALLNSEIYQNAKSKVEFLVFLAVFSVMTIGFLYIALFSVAYARGGF